MTKKLIDSDGLLYYDSIVKNRLDKKVNAEEGKGLSTNDLTDALLQKINNAGDSSFSGAYSALTGAPTNLSDFTNDVGFMTSTEVESQIGAAIANKVDSSVLDNYIKTSDYHIMSDEEIDTLLAGTTSNSEE